jgi:hypothetical protein
MSDSASATADREALLDTFVAELTRAAYDVALRHRAAATWLELELDLWRALADSVKQWGRKSSPVQVPLASSGLLQRGRRLLSW